MPPNALAYFDGPCSLMLYFFTVALWIQQQIALSALILIL